MLLLGSTLANGFFCCFVFLAWTSTTGANILKPPVKCYGLVPKITKGEYFFHDNDTYKLKLTTNVKLTMDLHQRSCFQVDIETTNGTGDVQSLFYAIEYQEYVEQYPVRGTYDFGFPEFQAQCECDCPRGKSFCSHDYERGSCNGAEICIRKYHKDQNSRGCGYPGPASLCCQIMVRPFQNRRFTAITIGQPTPSVRVTIIIYALYQTLWTEFRRYDRNILPFKGNYIHMNGFENVADMFVFADSANAHFRLPSGVYFYESDAPKFELLELRDMVNGVAESSMNKLGALRFRGGNWKIQNAETKLYGIHRPRVVNCKEQRYIDSYDLNEVTFVIRNATGHLGSKPFFGNKVMEREDFIKHLSMSKRISGSATDGALLISHKIKSAPTLKLDLALRQKMNVVTHLHASYVRSFIATVCLDKHGNRFLNATVIEAYGSFLIQLFKDSTARDIDVVLSITTNLPFSVNYTELLPLPSHVVSARFVCIHPAQKPKDRLCQMAQFFSEPLTWFELKPKFIETAGTCPGCNLETGPTFWSNFDPRNWLNGIDSISEAVAVGAEMLMYLVALFLILILLKKCCCPILLWLWKEHPKAYPSEKYLKGDA